MSATSNCGASLNYATSLASTTAFASNITSARTRAGCRRQASMWSARARARRAWASAQWATSCRSIIRWLVPGINADYFGPFGLDYNLRKSPTLEFVDYLYAAYGEKQPFSFHGKVHRTDSAHLAVTPFQRPHP